VDAVIEAEFLVEAFAFCFVVTVAEDDAFEV
jgi:hypothetical protein